MLDASIATQLKTHLAKITEPVELAASLDDGPKSAELEELLREIAGMSEQITLVRSDDDERRPSFAIRRVTGDLAASVRLRAFTGLACSTPDDFAHDSYKGPMPSRRLAGRHRVEHAEELQVDQRDTGFIDGVVPIAADRGRSRTVGVGVDSV